MKQSPPPQMPRINYIYAYLSVDEDGNEGVCAFQTSKGWLPLIGADLERLNDLRDVANGIVEETGRTIRLVRFSKREEIEIITKQRHS